MLATGSIDGTTTFGSGVVGTIADQAFQPTAGVASQLTGFAKLHIGVPADLIPDVTRKTRRGISVQMTEPVYVNGRPYTPKYLGKALFSASTITGVGHTRAFPDPDPVWNGSSWDVPPPPAPAGTGLIRWTVRSLPDPSGFPGGSYKLGAAEAGDGSSGAPVGTTSWSSAGGSTIAIGLNSRYPFKPTVVSHLHYAPDGSQHLETAGVRFTPATLAHMWADMGTFLAPPFTLLAVLVVTDYPGRYNYWHSVFDSGFDPTPNLSSAVRSSWLNGITGSVKVPGESYGYRTGLRIGRRQQAVFTDQTPGSRIGIMSYHCDYRPKMVGMVVNGNSSMMFDYSATGKLRKNLRLLNHGPQRFLTLGRVNGLLDHNYGASMVVFEIRAWNSALSTDHLQAQYDQLASTWKFHEYH